MSAPFLALLALAQAPEPAPVPPPSAFQLRLVPNEIQLDSARDRQTVLALGVRDDGVTQELGDEVAWVIADPQLATVAPAAHGVMVGPVHDGETTLLARWRGTEVRVLLRVRNASVQPPASFRNEIIPAFTAAGCNAGSCHGAASGKNGFGLSLFGYDPSRDHRTLTRDLRGRRLDLAAPEQSLLLQKATTGAVHQGGKRLTIGDASYQRLLDWIGEGARDDAERAVAVTGIELEPASAVLVGIGTGLPFVVRARFADGSDADVTATTLWSSGNDAVAHVSPQGQLLTAGRGEAVILARFHGHAAIARVRVYNDDAPFAWPAVAAANALDEHVFRTLQKARTAPAEPCSDAVFLRRIYLDLLSVLPTPAESQAFLADVGPDKRARLVDALLERSEFAAAQASMWADVLQVDAVTMEAKGAVLLGRHLRAAFAEHRPFDDVVRELLTADGPTFSTPAANFQLIAKQPHLVAEKTAQVFLGVRLQCAQCHNHPFERWSMDDYYGFAAFFGQVGKKRGLDPYELVVSDRGEGEVRNQKNGAVMAPRLLGAGVPQIAAGTDRRKVLALWLTSPDNAWFARHVANRAWDRLFGRGLVDPVDDVRIGNPASHPELLDALAKVLIEARFDVRAVYREIARSRTYQSGLAAPGTEPALFAGHRPRRLAAEPMLDAIGAVTGVATKYPGVPLGGPATTVDGGRNSVRFLDAFGRPARDGACTCDRRSDPTLGQTLHLINGETIASKIADSKGRLRSALAAKAAPAAMLEELFLAAYCRKLEPTEQERFLAALPPPDAKDEKAELAAWQDVYWAVLNSKEFLFQH